jgi:hypothetical protein
MELDLFGIEIKDIIRAVKNDFPVLTEREAQKRGQEICPLWSSYLTIKGKTLICYAHGFSFFTSKEKPIADKYAFTGIWFIILEEEKNIRVEVADFLRWTEKKLLIKIERHGEEEKKQIGNLQYNNVSRESKRVSNKKPIREHNLKFKGM